MRLRSVVAIAVGGVVDIATTNVLAFPLMVYAAIAHDLTRLPAEQVGPALLTALQASPSLQVVAWGLGLAATVLGGYVAARLARRAEVRHGALSAWFCMALGVYSLVAGDHAAPVWQHALAFVLSPLLGAIGGHLRRRQLDRRGGGTLAAATVVP